MADQQRKIVLPDAPPAGSARRSQSAPPALESQVPPTSPAAGGARDSLVSESKGEKMKRGGTRQRTAESHPVPTPGVAVKPGLPKAANEEAGVQSPAAGVVTVFIFIVVGGLLAWAFVVDTSPKNDASAGPKGTSVEARRGAEPIAPEFPNRTDGDGNRVAVGQPPTMSSAGGSGGNEQFSSRFGAIQEPAKTAIAPKAATAVTPTVQPDPQPPVRRSKPPPSLSDESSHAPPSAPSRTETISFVATVRVTSVRRNDTLSLRSGPSAKSRKLADIPFDAKGIKLISTSFEQTGSDLWYPVVWNGIQGWANGCYLDYEE